MEKIRARKQGRKNIYIHNDLLNAAYHYKTVVETKLQADDRKGIAFDCMSCLIMLAFAFEAELNFLGHKLIGGWKERQPFDNKLTEVLQYLKVTPDFAARPFVTIEGLKKFRDSLAHGKPVEIEYDDTVEGTPEELDRDTDLKGEWEEYCTPDFTFGAYADMDAVWKQLFKASKLSDYEARTHGMGGLSFIERIVEK